MIIITVLPKTANQILFAYVKLPHAINVRRNTTMATLTFRVNASSIRVISIYLCKRSFGSFPRHVSAPSRVEPPRHVSDPSRVEPPRHVSAPSRVEPLRHVSAPSRVEPPRHVSAPSRVEPPAHKISNIKKVAVQRKLAY